VQAVVNVNLPLRIVLGVTENMYLIICHCLVVRHMQELLYMIFLWRLIISDLKLWLFLYIFFNFPFVIV
jgi:hypothetical protein